MKKRTNKRDLTNRNARAYNKRFKEIEEQIGNLLYEVDAINQEIHDTNHQCKKVMNYFEQYFINKKGKK